MNCRRWHGSGASSLKGGFCGRATAPLVAPTSRTWESLLKAQPGVFIFSIPNDSSNDFIPWNKYFMLYFYPFSTVDPMDCFLLYSVVWPCQIINLFGAQLIYKKEIIIPIYGDVVRVKWNDESDWLTLGSARLVGSGSFFSSFFLDSLILWDPAQKPSQYPWGGRIIVVFSGLSLHLTNSFTSHNMLYYDLFIYMFVSPLDFVLFEGKGIHDPSLYFQAPTKSRGWDVLVEWISPSPASLNSSVPLPCLLQPSILVASLVS